MVNYGKGKYLKIIELSREYPISLSTVRRYVKQMVSIPKYRNSLLDLSHTMKLINVELWEQFLEEKGQGYYRNEKTA